MSTEKDWPLRPDEALQRLVEGNRRFTSGMAQHSQVSQERLAALVSQQRPFAAILGCSDSRVPVEFIFDQGFGDLFVLRLAGNIVTPGVLGSLQFAHQRLGVSVFVVLGHQGCGAVTATLDCKFHQAEHPEYIQTLVDLIAPGLREIDSKAPREEQLTAAVEANVRWSMEQCLRTPEFRRALHEQKSLRIVGAVYELATGRVRWLDS
jgi:carbonic anhydrase